jgi:drug/metabolite transporter (DMT)-like permease
MDEYKNYASDNDVSYINISRNIRESKIAQGKSWKILGFCILCLSITGGASIGSFSNFITVRNEFAKNSWRSGLQTLFMFFPAIIEYFYCRKTYDYTSLLQPKNYTYLIISLIMNALWVFGLTYASLNTIQSHAYVFNNTHGLFIVLFNFLMKVKLHKYEFIGTGLAIAGCIVMILDPAAMRADGIEPSIWVDIIAILSAIGGAFYFLMNS